MFLLRRRVPSNSGPDPSDFDAASTSVDPLIGSSLSCSTPSVKTPKTAQLQPFRRPSTQPRRRPFRRLSENEKARISIYLQIFDAMVSVSLSAMSTVWTQFASLVDIVKTKGFGELLYLIAAVAVTSIFLSISLALYAIVVLHQSLVWLCHTFLLVNVDFFSIKPRPSSPSFQMGRRASLETSLVTSSRRPSFSLSSSEFAERLNTRANGQPINMDALPLIDLSSHSSEAGDTPPLPEATIPAALSPTQLQLRSLSPAFDASMQGSKNEAPEPLEQPSTQSTTLPALSHGASLLKRKETVPLMVDAYGLSLPNEVARSMSTISYPDVGDNVSTSDDSSDIGGIMGAHISEEGSTAVQYSGRTDIDDDEDYEDDETENPLPDTEINEIALTDSPRYAPATLPSGPEPIDVLDPESRKASMDVSSLPTVEEEKLESPSPIAMPMPNAPIAPEVAQSSCTPPPSHVFTPPVASNSAESNLVESPRDVFSPTPVSFPQPVNHLSFFREQIHQRLQSDSGNPGAPENTSSSAEGPVKKDDGLVEPTPYPSPPFTPPSSRPPTVYSSMAPALQMPSIDANVNPVVSEKGQLSALVEEVKADLDAEKKTFVPEEPTQAPDQDVNEDESPAPKEEPTKNHFPEPITHASPSMPEPPAMLEPLPIAETLTNSPDSSEIKMPTPPSNLLFQRAIAGISLPRVASPVTSIGKGGISNGSRINVDDMGRYAHSSWDVTKEEKTLMNGTAEERLNEVDNNAVDEDTSPTRPRSPGSGADDESAAPRSMTDMRKKKKKKSRSSKAKKEVSFDEASFIIGSEQEKEPGDKTGNANVELKTATASDASLPSSSISNLIPIPRSFEIEDDDSSEAPPLRPSMDVSNGSIRGSPIPSRMSVLAESRRNSIFSEIMSPRSTADELSDSSSAFPLALGEFSARQVDSYARWFARVHRDKSLPTIQGLRNQMKECSDTELASRLKLGSRAEPTKLSKTLVGEEGIKRPGSPSIPPIRKNTRCRRK